LQKAGITVSLFIDPNPKQIETAKEKIGADYVEIHTGAFAEARDHDQEKREVRKISEAVDLAFRIGLGVNAGHGLDYHNIRQLLAIELIEEFSIGHSIIARALMVGMAQAVKEMLVLIKG